MSRISSTFSSLAESGRKALIPYITAGDPHPDHTVALMHALVEAGADIIELGVPFSDPMADGRAIQAACERALTHDTSLPRVLDMVSEFRERDERTPVVLMGYQNPIEAMGVPQFARAAKQNRVDGVIIVDLPMEQAMQALNIYRQEGLDVIFLIAPTTRTVRIKKICDVSSGFVYYVSLKGVTGSNRLNVAEVKEKVARIKRVSALPVGVGFGVRNAEDAGAVAEIADAVVVGSALVRLIEANAPECGAMLESVKSLLIDMRTVMDDTVTRQGVACS